MDIYLLRHGQTTQPGTFTGITEVLLSDAGEDQIREIAPLLKSVDIEHCYCSPLVRCRDTLRLLELSCDFTVDRSLKEINFGLWEGLDYNRIKQDFPGEIKRWDKQRERFSFPGGENVGEFNTRVKQWFDDLVHKGHNRVLVVAHGGVLRVGLSTLLGIDDGTVFGLNFEEGAVAKVSIRAGFPYLERFNCRG